MFLLLNINYSKLFESCIMYLAMKNADAWFYNTILKTSCTLKECYYDSKNLL